MHPQYRVRLARHRHPSSSRAKCAKDGEVIYTGQSCPSGSRELAVDGAVTSLLVL